jgi:hypothetical protein
MRYLLHIVILTSATCFCHSACCRALPPQPTAPTQVDGWKDSDSGSGFRFRAVLMLKQGGSSSSGNLGVKVTNILEAEPCGDVGIEYHRRATFQFFNPAGGQVFCENTVPDKTNMRITCADKIGVDVIGVRDISTAEKWALFDLRR